MSLLAKRCDELAVAFNSKKDPKERLSILEEREKLMKKIIDHNKLWSEIDKRYNSGQKLYDKATKMQQDEMAKINGNC